MIGRCARAFTVLDVLRAFDAGLAGGEHRLGKGPRHLRHLENRERKFRIILFA